MSRTADMESAPDAGRRSMAAWFMMAVLFWLVATVRPVGLSGQMDTDSTPLQHTADLIADSIPFDAAEASASDMTADVDEDLDAPASPRRRVLALPLTRELPRAQPRPHDPFVPLRPPIPV